MALGALIMLHSINNAIKKDNQFNLKIIDLSGVSGAAIWTAVKGGAALVGAGAAGVVVKTYYGLKWLLG